METSELIKKVRKIEIKTKNISNHLFQGEYHSMFKGKGMSFSEVRDYQYGDDIRNIDWNVTARANSPFVKVFEEERELTMMLMIDVSGSSYFGLNNSKIQIMTEISAVLAFSALGNNDKVGAIFFTDKVELYIPPKKGKSHILRIIRESLEMSPSSTKTNIEVALRYLNNIQRKKSIVFLLSDFDDLAYNDSLKIVSKRHDFIGIRVQDEFDKELPKLGLIQCMDSETGELRWINTSSKKVQNAFKENVKNTKNYFEESFLKSKANNMIIDTNQDYINVMLGFFNKRRK